MIAAMPAVRGLWRRLEVRGAVVSIDSVSAPEAGDGVRRVSVCFWEGPVCAESESAVFLLRQG
jgi:hypothetical protein